MLWLDEHNAEEYLRTSCAIGPSARVHIEALPGGVSNQVLYVKDLNGRGQDFVLKQVRPQLRTPQPWFSSVERIWREVEVLRVCQEILSGSRSSSTVKRQIQTPAILFEDRTCYTFAMTAAPRQHAVWKSQLLAGEADAVIAAECGGLLARLHGGAWRSAEVAHRLADRTLFDELRIDPYYRTVGALDDDARTLMQALIDSLALHACSLVHADFSPKNLLVYPGGLMMVDFETGHYGDPAFDVGFFLSHLVLKAVYHAPDHERLLALTEHFWEAYRTEMCAKISPTEYEALVARGIGNFAGCAWARIDGKSRVEYLKDSPRREPARHLCRSLLRDPPGNWPGVLDRCRQMINNGQEM